MPAPSELKLKLFTALEKAVVEKIQHAQSAIESAKESRDRDTKSSAGDKHETSRAMAQIELDNLDVQLGKWQKTYSDLEQIDPALIHSKAEPGSLVITATARYFISIGLGKIELEGNTYFAISMGSPIGQTLKQKSAGETVSFQGAEILIEEIH